MLTKSITQWILFIIYIIAACISVLICDVKARSLGFQTRDYPFYLEFSSKLLDSNSARTYSLNPEGRNWLSMNGYEGVRNFHQSLHFEPVKYIYAILYKIFQTPYALFIFIALVFFFPLHYIAYAMPMNSQAEMRNAITLGILYILPPSAIYVPTFDIRPYIFLAPFFFLTILSIQFSRPIWEQVFFFNTLFLAREEAIILGAVVILFGIVNKRSRHIQPKVFLTFCVSYGVWFMITAAFMRWSNYPIKIGKIPAVVWNILEKLEGHDPLLVLGLLAGCVVTCSALWFFWRNFKNRPVFQALLDVFAIGSVFVPLGYQLTFEYKASDLAMYPFLPRYYLYYIALILFIVVILGHFKLSITGRVWLGLMAITVTTIVVINTVSPYGFLKTYIKFDNSVQNVSEIWSTKENLSPYKSHLLVDYETYQAFYDIEKTYVYNRLSWATIGGTKRFYPANNDILLSLINEQIDYIIISRASSKDIDNILAESSTQRKVLFENEQFIGMEIIRK